MRMAEMFFDIKKTRTIRNTAGEGFYKNLFNKNNKNKV